MNGTAAWRARTGLLVLEDGAAVGAAPAPVSGAATKAATSTASNTRRPGLTLRVA